MVFTRPQKLFVTASAVAIITGCLLQLALRYPPSYFLLTSPGRAVGDDRQVVQPLAYCEEGAGPDSTPLSTETGGNGGGPGKIWLHISGAVGRPGVYEAPVGARVFTVLQQAGGVLPQGDESQVNLAAVVADGMRIHIPLRGEAREWMAGNSPGGGSAPVGGRLDLNRGTTTELEALPGIGEVLARRIVEYRREHGPFHSVEELVQVKGIGEKMMQKLRPLVGVTP